MSRLIVKNLPKNIKEEKITKLFSQKGDITDVQLKYTPEGKFRQFCFVGYRTPEQAQAAIDYFHNTCINTSRITVELCANLGDSAKPKSWSKYAADSSAYQEKAKQDEKETTETKSAKKKRDQKNEKNPLEEHKDDPLFEEYLATKTKGLVWANDDILTKNDKSIDESEESENEADSGKASSDSEDIKPADAQISDLEYMKSLMVKKPRQKMEKTVRPVLDLFTVKLHGLSYNCKKKDLKHFFKPLVPYSIRIPRNAKGFAFVGFKSEKELTKALLKDKSFINGKQISVFKYVKKSTDGEESTEDSNKNKFKNTPWKDKEELLKNEEDIATSGKIFVRNLAYTTSEEELQNVFEKYGPLTEVNLPVDKTTRQIKGFGTITFVFPEHAAKAYCELDGSIYSGRMLHLLPVKSTPEENNDQEEDEGTNYKKKKEKKQKEQAGSSHNWNSLFIDSNAAANVIAKNFETTKENLLGTDVDTKTNTSAAVRLALGETQLVQNIQSYLESHDIHLDAFSVKNPKRSKTVILVKNLPSGATEQELREKFKKFGPLNRVIFPPNGLTAVIEYYEPSEARDAFKKLAYTKFINAPLYLEWAPENVFKNESKNPLPKPIEEETEKPVEEDEEPEPNTVLFVKNLYFGTTDEDLHNHFSKIGRLKYATVATKNNSAKPGEKLSMGYGFVRFILQSDAEEALKRLQFSELHGKTLEIKRSERSTQEDVVSSRKVQKLDKQNGSKLLVRNIPFQANKKEVRDLFAPFGEIKALRLPQKMSGESHRGFAFIDYHTKADAKRAFKALSQSTHLYGRRLVLEWAESDIEDVTELRKRTAEQMQQGSKAKCFKKSSIEVGEKDEKDEEM